MLCVFVGDVMDVVFSVCIVRCGATAPVCEVLCDSHELLSCSECFYVCKGLCTFTEMLWRNVLHVRVLGLCEPLGSVAMGSA